MEKTSADQSLYNPEERWSALQRVWNIIGRLRGENGCPWDRQQTPVTVQTYLVEEAHEAAAAVRAGLVDEVAEELGDLLFMVLFMIHLYEEAGQCTVESVCDGIAEKMVRRHPHVFGDTAVASAEDVRAKWEKIKEKEKKDRPFSGLGVPASLPALIRASRLLSRIKNGELFGLPTDHEEAVLHEAAAHLTEGQEMRSAQAAQWVAQGLLALVAMARRHGVRPEDCLHMYLNDVERRAFEQDSASKEPAMDQKGPSHERASMTA